MKRMLALVLSTAVALSLTGCGSIFNRSYSYVTVHQTQTASEEDASIPRAANYAELVSCVQRFVSLGQETGTVHIYNYSGNLDSDISTACEEVLSDDPLGAYVLENISNSCKQIVSYYECTFQFSYRHSVSDIASIITCYGSVSFRDQFTDAFQHFTPSLVIKTSDFYADRNEMLSIAQDAYYRSPETALGYPEITMQSYPDHGPVRILEFTFEYPLAAVTLQSQADTVSSVAAQLVGQDTTASDTVSWLLYSRLLEHSSYAPEGSSSVYDALSKHSANSEGMALAYSALCQLAGIPCKLVQGTLDGVPHCWNIIKINNTYWHVDLCRADPEDRFVHNDDTMSSLSYIWSPEHYPVCSGIETPPTESPEPVQEGSDDAQAVHTPDISVPPELPTTPDEDSEDPALPDEPPEQDPPADDSTPADESPGSDSDDSDSTPSDN